MTLAGALQAQGAPETPAASAAPSASSAMPGESAGMRFDRGVQFYKSGAHAMALVEFRRAYELVSNYRVLYNIGQACYQLHDFACALDSFQRYLKDGGAEIPAERQSSVTTEITTLESLVATLQVTTEPGADILIDDVLVGRAPLASPVVLNPGRRKLTVSRAGRPSATRWLVAASADKIDIQVDLGADVPAAAPSASASSPPRLSPVKPVVPPAQPQQRESSPLWIGWMSAGVLASGAVVTGVLALRASNDLQNDRERVPVTRATLDDDASRARNLALTTDILAGLAAVTAGGTLYFTLRERSRTKDSPQPASARIQPTLNGIQVTGAF